MNWKKSGILILGCTLALLGIGCSCNREESNTLPPVLAFQPEAGYTSMDTTVSIGTNITIGITAHTSGTNLTYLNVSMDNGTVQTVLDSGMNCPTLTFHTTIIKSFGELEKWTFTVMDKDRNKASISLKLTKAKDSSFGNIKTFGPLTLGAQNNGSNGNFLSLADGSIYDLQQAYQNQQLIDIIYYYGSYNATLSSPNEAEVVDIYTGTYGISAWSVKNESRYDTTLISPDQFDALTNDSLLIAAYDPVNAKRKGKFVQAGQVYSVHSPAGKLGLLKVITVNGTDDGSFVFTIKIQE